MNCLFKKFVVPNIKDINFWEQFTTQTPIHFFLTLLFRISKISTFESNSQPSINGPSCSGCCSEYQRYQLLRAIHNQRLVDTLGDDGCSEYQRYQLLRAIHNWGHTWNMRGRGCSEYQRYQLLRAIHNCIAVPFYIAVVVPNIKDINFWEQFTTIISERFISFPLFRISKISTFESNSQRTVMVLPSMVCCSEYQRYQLLRAIHNAN